MDILLLGHYTRFSYFLIRCNSQRAEITMLIIHLLYPIPSPPTKWAHERTDQQISSMFSYSSKHRLLENVDSSNVEISSNAIFNSSLLSVKIFFSIMKEPKGHRKPTAILISEWLTIYITFSKHWPFKGWNLFKSKAFYI